MRPRALLATAALLLASRGALAQSAGPSVDVRGFHPPTGPESGFFLEPADAPGTFDWNAGLWVSYAYRPITLRSTKTGAITSSVIAHQLTSDLVGSVGLAHRLAVGFDLPVLIEQTGDPLSERSRRLLGDTPLPGQALGDLGIAAKLTLMRPTAGDLGGIAMALYERFTLPTGDEASYLGEGAVTSETRLLLEYRLAAVGVHATAGVLLRTQQERFACGGIPLDAPCPTQFGHALPFGVGFSLKPQIFGVDPDGHTTLYLELHGHTPLTPNTPFQSTAVSSLQASLGARYALRDVSLFGGVETALSSGIGDSPLRLALAVSWAPRGHDVDGDGIEDDLDQCLELAEDKDGYKDDDGCPDADNDEDGVPDNVDKCPGAKEDEDGHGDDDGCPDPDNDGDGIPDTEDKCPNELGGPSPDPKKNGCPVREADGDGIEGDADKCPNEPEDKDGYKDDDGCPDPDNDGDGLPDVEDRCPNEKGAAADRGCPDPDSDKDTLLLREDKCPDRPEVWNGVDDDDGCPDAGPPLVTVKDTAREAAGKAPALTVLQAVKFTAEGEIEPASLPVLRAIAAELLAHPTWSVTVGVRPAPRQGDKGGDAEATTRAGALVTAIRRYARRVDAAEAAGWDTVKAAPRAAELGIGFALALRSAPKPAAPAPR